MKKIFILLLFLFTIFEANGQYLETNEIHYGVSLRATLDINGLENNFAFTNFNMVLTGGLGFHPFEQPYLYPTLHTSLLFYNRGDLGASYKKSFFESVEFEIITGVMLSGGLTNKRINHFKRIIPLYNFSQITTTPLVNPFTTSIGLGTNWVFTFNKYKDFSQRIGFLNIMIDRRFQLNTINDGFIFSKIGLSDGYDRYHTGAGMLTWHSDSDNLFDSFEFSFYKYTGHEEGLFDTANILQVDKMNFKNNETIFYNKNRLRMRMNSSKYNFGLHITAHNTDKDVQDFIHLLGDWSFFPDIFEDKKGISNELKRLGVGGSYFNVNSNL